MAKTHRSHAPATEASPASYPRRAERLPSPCACRNRAEYHFPTPIYIKELLNAVQLNPYLEQQVIKWSQVDPQGHKRTNVNGWHSTTDMNKKEEYNVLTKELFAMQDEIFKKEFLTQKPVLGNMWANIH